MISLNSITYIIKQFKQVYSFPVVSVLRVTLSKKEDSIKMHHFNYSKFNFLKSIVLTVKKFYWFNGSIDSAFWSHFTVYMK